jgi:hypothetical protein
MPSFAVHLEVYLGRQLIVTFITIFFFFYPSVVQSLMTIFNCQEVNVVTNQNPLAVSRVKWGCCSPAQPSCAVDPVQALYF